MVNAAVFITHIMIWYTSEFNHEDTLHVDSINIGVEWDGNDLQWRRNLEEKRVEILKSNKQNKELQRASKFQTCKGTLVETNDTNRVLNILSSICFILRNICCR